MPDEWLTYAQLGRKLGISTAAARQLSRRRDWQRRTPNAYGIPATVLVPSEVLENASKTDTVPQTDGVRTGSVELNANGLHTAYELAVMALTQQLDRANHRIESLEAQLADASEKGPETDPLPAIGIQTLSQTVEMLREDVGHERDRADQAERRIDELLHDLAEERRRIDGLHTDLADARTAAMISGSEAAALRSRLDLTDRRPWWRRWFR
jgi:predicted RNase H-like nuclease (RuvC/YqgF family)